VTRGERQLTDPDDGLLRRVQKKPHRLYDPVPDQITGRLRAPTAAFEPRFADPEKPTRKVDEALSVNVQSSLCAASLTLMWGAESRKHYIARVTVADCSAHTLEAWHAPTRPPDQPDNPHHGLIWGLVEMHGIDQLQYERTIDALARASTIITDELVSA
jgi:hypothetical protein